MNANLDIAKTTVDVFVCVSVCIYNTHEFAHLDSRYSVSHAQQNVLRSRSQCMRNKNIIHDLHLCVKPPRMSNVRQI